LVGEQPLEVGGLGQKVEAQLDQGGAVLGGLLDLDLHHLVPGPPDDHADLRDAGGRAGVGGGTRLFGHGRVGPSPGCGRPGGSPLLRRPRTTTTNLTLTAAPARCKMTDRSRRAGRRAAIVVDRPRGSRYGQLRFTNLPRLPEVASDPRHSAREGDGDAFLLLPGAKWRPGRWR